MRLFLAVDLDDVTREAVAEASWTVRRAIELSAPSARFSWTSPERMHVTLHFLGTVDRLDDAAEIVHEPIPVNPFVMHVSGVGMFPGRGRPRVIWVGVGAELGELHAVHRVLAARLNAARLVVEAGPYMPHVTLARTRRAVPRELVAAALTKVPAHLGRCPVRQVTLYESQLRGSRSVYVPVAVAALAGPTPPRP